jgi:hypothetical protein
MSQSKEIHMKNQWKTTTLKLFGYSALRNSETGELAAFGERGQLFAINDQTPGVIIYLPNGEERLSRPKDLTAAMRKLGIPLLATQQLDFVR